MFHGIYSGKRVLVTGDTGFKGSWLCIWLKHLGADVVGYGLEPPTVPSNHDACRLGEIIEHVSGDIRDPQRLEAVFRDKRPAMVFHLAAQSLVRFSYEQPVTTFAANLAGTVNVLEAVRRSATVGVVVNITSDKCYENRGWPWGYRENDALGGKDPYSASKACAEIAFASYLRCFFESGRIGAASVRVGNAIGGGDWGTDRLIPDCVRSLSRDLPIHIRMAKAVRPWQHVLEPLSAYLWLGALLWQDPQRYSGAYNIGPRPEGEVTVSQIVAQVVSLWGKGDWQAVAEDSTRAEAATLRLSSDLAYARLGWRPVLSIEQALALTVEWYRWFYQSPSAGRMHTVCLEQIRDYQDRGAAAGLPWACSCPTVGGTGAPA